MHLQCLKLLRPTVMKQMHLQENTVFDLGVKVTQDVAQHPLHHVTFAFAMFDAATSNYKGDAFRKKIQYLTLTIRTRSHKMLPSTLYIK